MTRRTAVPMLLTLALVALPVFGMAQTQKTNAASPHFHGQAPGEAQQRLRQVKGVIHSVDAKSRTLTVESAGKLQTFEITSKTRFIRPNGARGAFSDVVPGKKAELTLQMIVGQPDQLVAINLKAD